MGCRQEGALEESGGGWRWIDSVRQSNVFCVPARPAAWNIVWKTSVVTRIGANTTPINNKKARANKQSEWRKSDQRDKPAMMLTQIMRNRTHGNDFFVPHTRRMNTYMEQNSWRDKSADATPGNFNNSIINTNIHIQINWKKIISKE